ncbi:hypothetical protein [Pantoea stewartii]|uniref:hypothetical protein n=1 Tax=Pantoea stewartii TaxID=66269 RepID=UPI003868DA9D
MQFGKSSEKLREKTARQCARQRSASAPCRRRWLRCWASSMTRHSRSCCASLPPANRCRPHFPRNPHAVAGRNHLSGMRRRTQRAGLRRIGAAGAYQQRL